LPLGLIAHHRPGDSCNVPNSVLAAQEGPADEAVAVTGDPITLLAAFEVKMVGSADNIEGQK
jgi:hypothetical protein